MINTCVMKQDILEEAKKIILQRAFYTSRCQARLRGHEWYISQEEFFELWSTNDRWASRGRHSDDLTMSRIDMAGDWSMDNVQICTRREMLKAEAQYRRQKNGNA